MRIETVTGKFSFPVLSVMTLLFAAANLYSYITMDARVGMIDGPAVCGFPFTFYYYSGWVGPTTVWTGLIADSLIAIVVSGLASMVWKKIFKMGNSTNKTNTI